MAAYLSSLTPEQLMQIGESMSNQASYAQKLGALYQKCYEKQSILEQTKSKSDYMQSMFEMSKETENEYYYKSQLEELERDYDITLDEYDAILEEILQLKAEAVDRGISL